MWEMHLYRISRDGGVTWTEQWLTDNEAKEEGKEHLCERANAYSVKRIYA